MRTKLEQQLRDEAERMQARHDTLNEEENGGMAAHGCIMATLAYEIAANMVMSAHARGKLTEMEGDE